MMGLFSEAALAMESRAAEREQAIQGLTTRIEAAPVPPRRVFRVEAQLLTDAGVVMRHWVMIAQAASPTDAIGMMRAAVGPGWVISVWEVTSEAAAIFFEMEMPT